MRLPIPLTAALLLAACQPAAEAPAPAAPAAPAVGTGPAPATPAATPPPQDAVVPAEASSTACRLDQGADAARKLVDRCVAVSPATRPPCNAENPCQAIQDEIDRACALWERQGDAPAACRAE